MTGAGGAGRWSLVLGTLLLIGSSTAVLATQNTPPKILTASVSPNVLNEGQSAVLSLSFADPDSSDAHTLRVKWHDTSVDFSTEVHQLPPGQTSIQLPHTFRDSANGPSFSKVQVTVYDRQTPPGTGNDNTDYAGQDVIFIPVEVRNVAPSIVQPIRSTSTRVSPTQVRVTLDGAVADPSEDTHQMQATKWAGDRMTTDSTPCTVSEHRFHCELTYPANQIGSTQKITVRVTDDDGASGSATTSVTLTQ